MAKTSSYLLSSAILLTLALPSLAQPAEESETAWAALLRDAPGVAGTVTATERRLLQALTAEQADALAEGADPASFTLVDGRTLDDILKGLSSFDLSWWTVDSGGSTSGGGSFRLSGTIGQFDSASLSGGNFVLHGGFWSESPVLFTDGFEIGSAANWSSTSGGS